VCRPTRKLEDHCLSAIRDCLHVFNIFAATLHTGGRSSICNLRTRHSLVTRTYVVLAMDLLQRIVIILEGF